MTKLKSLLKQYQRGPKDALLIPILRRAPLSIAKKIYNLLSRMVLFLFGNSPEGNARAQLINQVTDMAVII